MKIKELTDQEQKVINALGNGDLEVARHEFLEWQKLRGDFLQYLLAEVLITEKQGKKMTKRQYKKVQDSKPPKLDISNAYNLDQIPTDEEIKQKKR